MARPPGRPATSSPEPQHPVPARPSPHPHLLPHARRQRGQVQAHAGQHERLQLKHRLGGGHPGAQLLQPQVVQVGLRLHRLHQPVGVVVCVCGGGDSGMEVCVCEREGVCLLERA